jgi:hypothetical protein
MNRIAALFSAQRRVELDYIAPVRRPAWPGLLLLAVALAVSALVLERYRDVRQELARYEAQAGLVLPGARTTRALPKERLDEQAKSAEAVVRQLTLPWGSLIGAIEQAATRDVAILQLQPDAEQRVLRLTAEARNRDAMFEYLKRLGGARELSNVVLVSHQVQRDEPQQPIQFSVQALLK